ncbi:hypothetical protein TRFO_06960 [Tritrichomonas foetus]|uniref:Katanin p80 subunit C-terminal domain-containing protein n=1 Tax=Tritrichomonas foetus TaxID=1144522 RepID=A0A1J4JZE5_9EUKA|nr:hypothetical protein TRFO_06960 [Tritrichomonas foetus]|eukprot:OHT02900.1 hypothetical protein TRFO_06960 [Tritrichomonas foetus]
MSKKSAIIRLQKVKAHNAAITTMCIGQRTGVVYATGGEDSMLNLWSVGNATPPAVLGPLPSPVTSCVFSSSENEICCANQGGTVILFDIVGSKALINWSAHSSAVNSICYNPADPKTFLSCGVDGTIRILSSNSRKPTATIKAHDGPVNCVAISPDGRYAASAGDDKTVRLFDLNTYSQLTSFSQHSNAATYVQFHPTLPYLISGGADRLSFLYDLEQYVPIETNFPHHSSKIVAAKFSNEVDSLAVTASDDSLSILSIDPIQHIERVSIQCGHVCDIALVQNNVLIASSERDHAIITRVKFDPSLFTDMKNDCGLSDKIKGKGSKRPTSSSIEMNSVDIYKMFKKERNAFLSQLSEKNARIVRLGDLAAQKGLIGVLEEAAAKPEMGIDVLTLLKNKKQALKLDHAIPILLICSNVIKTRPELAVETVDNILNSFGKIVYTTRGMAGQAVGVDIALEERKEKSENFVYNYRKVAIGLKHVAKGSNSLAKAAKRILDEWSVLVK